MSVLDGISQGWLIASCGIGGFIFWTYVGLAGNWDYQLVPKRIVWDRSQYVYIKNRRFRGQIPWLKSGLIAMLVLMILAMLFP